MSEQEHIFSRKEIAEMEQEEYEKNREQIFKQMKNGLIRWSMNFLFQNMALKPN